MALAHADRVATMGQLTASITHEVNQPITAAVTYALAARKPHLADLRTIVSMLLAFSRLS